MNILYFSRKNRDPIQKLGHIFKEMEVNYNSFGNWWKNIPLAHDAFEIIKSLPDTLPREYEIPVEKMALLELMLENMDETSTPRFCIEVREYMQTLSPTDEGNLSKLTKLRDFIDLTLPLEDYCKRYRRTLKFDPVERTSEYESLVYDVEREVARRLKFVRRRRGFCFAHWIEKKKALTARGIEWESPGALNPRVIFD